MIYIHNMSHQELMSHQRIMKLLLPAGCHHNPNLLLITFHIRKVISHYVKPCMDCT